jgi:hypothetical protein
MTDPYRHLTPEDLQQYVPGVFRYEKEADMAERAVEAYKGHLRAQVLALRDEAMDHNWPDAIVAYQTVLALLGPE